MSETSSTIERCVQLLEAISSDGVLSPQQAAERLGASRSSVQRLLMLLHQRGFIIRTAQGFGLATYLRVIADVALRSLRSASHNVLHELADACHETVVIYVADGDDVVVLDEATPTAEQAVRVRHAVGTRTPLGAGAAGPAFLAHAAPATRERILHGASPSLGATLDRVLADGFLLRPEARAGVSELAVPVLDGEGRSIASLAILAPTARAQGLPDWVEPLREGAARIVAVRHNDDEDRRP